VIAATVPLTLRAALPDGRARAAATWAAHMWAYKVEFEVPYDKSGALGRRVRVDPELAFDRALGCGVALPQRLQRRLRHPDRISALDVAAGLVYVAWELEPHAVLAWILLRYPGRFRRSAIRLGATFDLTLLGYWLWPAAPPWWASERAGRMGGDVVRVVPRIGRRIRNEQLDQDDEQGANPWAAMPSDHFASVVMTAIVAADADRSVGVLATAYALALGSALVYLGEHYVADLLGGLAVVGVVQLIDVVAARS
jgi:membrane-associated phospholipid phosphatase